MLSKCSIFTSLAYTVKKRRHATNYNNDHTANAPQPTPHMFDSAFTTSTKTDFKWEDELERIQQYGQQLANNWYEALEQLTLLMDKMTSPFLNRNRISLHRAQLFIESYRDDWKNGRSGKNTYQEKIQQATHRFSDNADLKQCAMGIFDLENDLFNYRQTMDQQLALLWTSLPADQSMDNWDDYMEQLYDEMTQMESKFNHLLETSSPYPSEYTCAVCLSIFTDPITLQPCLHTFCKDCVQHIYCTCQLSHCDSSCHDATNRPSNTDDDDDDDDDDEDDDHNNFDHSSGNLHKKPTSKTKRLSQRLSSTYKPRYKSMIPPKTSIPTPPSTSPGMYSYLRSPLERFTNKKSSPSPSSTDPTTGVNTEDAGSDEDSAMEISLLPTPAPQPPMNTTNNTVNINAGSVTLQCSCPLSWSIPPAAQCPLCRHPFGPDDCTPATALDNMIRFYFPRHDKARQRYNARQRQLKRRSFLISLAQKWLPTSLVTVPLPSRRLPPTMSSPSPAPVPMMMII